MDGVEVRNWQFASQDSPSGSMARELRRTQGRRPARTGTASDLDLGTWEFGTLGLGGARCHGGLVPMMGGCSDGRGGIGGCGYGCRRVDRALVQASSAGV